MEAKQKIAVIIINKAGQIYLQKEKYRNGSAHKWNIVTGGIDADDQSSAAAAERECLEEAGLEAKNLEQIGILKTHWDSQPKIYHIFLANSKNDIFKLPQSAEQAKFGESIIEQRWFAPEEITKFADTDFVTNSTYTIIREFAAGNLNDTQTIKMDKETVY